jgi:DNA invertase Pin-like site-specific DNA recombinase
VRVAIYARVSTKDKGQDVDNQIRQLEDFCRQRGWVVIDNYVDHETGSTGDRVHFVQLMLDAKRRKFDLVLFWALDRFTRQGALETLQHLQLLTSYGVDYQSFTEQYIDSCGVFRDVVIAIIATIAKQERIRISERTKAGVERARENGAKIGRPAVAADTARIHTLRAQGWSLRAIALELNLSLGTVCRQLKMPFQNGEEKS